MSPIEELTEYNLTVDEVATLFGVNARTVRRWINDGKLPAHRLPGTRKFKLRRADIDDALKEKDGAPADDGREQMSSQDITSLLQAGTTEP
jgi:excisionase family DNA binding protein